MKKLDSPLFNIIITILILVGLYFAYQWVFDEIEKDSLGYVGTSSERINIGISGDHRMSGYSGSGNAGRSGRGAKRPAVTGLPPSADAFATGMLLSAPVEGSSLSGKAVVRRNYAAEGIQQPMVYAVHTGESHSNRTGAMPGGGGSYMFFSGRRSTTGSQQVRPQGALAIAQNNLNQTQPFRSAEEDPLVPRKPDPGTDPTGNPIPLSDGNWIMLVLAGVYLAVKLKQAD